MLQYQAVIKDLPECIVYSKRMRIPCYDSYFQIIPNRSESGSYQSGESNVPFLHTVLISITIKNIRKKISM